MRKLFSLLGIENDRADTPRESAVELIAGSPEQIAEVIETARQEIAKLREDKSWIENRLRDDIEQLRNDRLELNQKLTDRDSEIVQLSKDVEAAKDSAGEKAREMLRGAGHAPIADANIDQEAITGPLGSDEKIFFDYKNMEAGADRLAFSEKHKDALARYTNSQ